MRDNNEILKLKPSFNGFVSGFELFLAALIYSGMEPAEIAAATLYGFEKLNMRDGSCCYTLLVCRRVRKLNQLFWANRNC